MEKLASPRNAQAHASAPEATGANHIQTVDWQIPAWQMPIPANIAKPMSQPTPKVKKPATPASGIGQVAAPSVAEVKALAENRSLAPVKAKKPRRLPIVGEEPELRDPTRFGIALSVINVALYSVMSLAQWIGWGGFYAATGMPGRLIGDAMAVMMVNLGFGLLTILGVFVLKPMHFRARVRYPLIALVSLVAAAPRVLAMMSIYTTPSGPTFLFAEWMSGFVAGTIAVSAGVLTAGLVGRARREHARWMSEHEKLQRASDDLHTEEMRVRRMVADQLHGRLQYRLVTIAAGMDADAAKFAHHGSFDAAEAMTGFANQIDQVREQEVRALSHAVYPAGIELGAVTAIKAMIHRLPPQISASLNTGPNLTRAIEAGITVMPLAERLIAVFTIEEAITNALKHGQAKSLAIELEVNDLGDGGQMVLDCRVDDDGRGLQLPASAALTKHDAEAHTGLARHTERLTTRGGDLTIANRVGGGTRLEFTLPFFPLAEIS